MGVNKVVLGTTTIVDITDSTVTAESMLQGTTAYGADGEKVTGEIAISRGSTTEVVTPQMGWNIGKCLKMSYNPTERRVFFPGEAMLDLVAPFSEFGDATAEDVAEGKTFTSADGLLVHGTAKAEVYTPLAYLEGSGSQWIDTGISGGTNASYELLFQHTADEYEIQSYDYLFAGAKTGAIPFITYYTWNGFHANVDGGVYGTTFAYKKDAKDITAGLRYNSDGTVQSKWGSEDWKQLTIEQGSASAVAGKGWGNKNWYVFNCPDENNIITMRLYYLKMYTNGELVRDFVPVRRGSDGECGLYDNISGEFFGNSGTGAFTGISQSEYASATINEYAEALSILGVSV